VRALTRKPDEHAKLADEVVMADVNRPETPKAALSAYGVFLVTNAWEARAEELKQALSKLAWHHGSAETRGRCFRLRTTARS
jgi:hypothetical protein